VPQSTKKLDSFTKKIEGLSKEIAPASNGELRALLGKLLTNQDDILLAKMKMGAIMAAWQEHDIRFSELNINGSADLQRISTTFKERSGFIKYLTRPGMQKEMMKVFSVIHGNLFDSEQLIESVMPNKVPILKVKKPLETEKASENLKTKPGCEAKFKRVRKPRKAPTG
jgi:hypothetical protein